MEVFRNSHGGRQEPVLLGPIFAIPTAMRSKTVIQPLQRLIEGWLLKLQSIGSSQAEITLISLCI